MDFLSFVNLSCLQADRDLFVCVCVCVCVFFRGMGENIFIFRFFSPSPRAGLMEGCVDSGGIGETQFGKNRKNINE